MSRSPLTSSNYLSPSDHTGGGKPKNVGGEERILSIVGGATLAYLGLRRGSIGGILAAAAGGAIVCRGATGFCGLYQALGVTSARPAPPEKYFKSGIYVDVSITIDKPAAELYAFWRDFENLPTFMAHLRSVKVHDGDGKRSSWIAKGPAGTSPTWDAEIINDEPGRLIAWRSLAGASVDNVGSVRFVDAPPGRGTEVHVVLDYIPPGRQVGRLIAKLFGEEPKRQIETDLRRFKQLMETGEITTAQSSPENAPVEQ